MFVREGWSKQDVRDYVVANTRATVADLGGGAGGRMQITVPYQVSTNSVTKKIEFGN